MGDNLKCGKTKILILTLVIASALEACEGAPPTSAEKNTPAPTNPKDFDSSPGLTVQTTKGTLLPVAFLEFNDPSAGTTSCTAGLYAKNILITASHCIVRLDSNNCNKNIKIRWFQTDKSGTIGLSSSAVECTKTSTYQTNDSGSKIDLATLELSTTSEFPESTLVLSSELPQRYSTVTMMSLDLKKQIKSNSGKVMELSTSFFLSTISNSGGFSGAPVFLSTTSEGENFSTGLSVVGIHLASSDELSRAVDFREIQKILSVQKNDINSGSK